MLQTRKQMQHQLPVFIVCFLTYFLFYPSQQELIHSLKSKAQQCFLLSNQHIRISLLQYLTSDVIFPHPFTSFNYYFNRYVPNSNTITQLTFFCNLHENSTRSSNYECKDKRDQSPSFKFTSSNVLPFHEPKQKKEPYQE